MKELTHIDLFSGIGGFALSARWAGIKTVQFVEIDPFCQKVLQKNFKGVPIHDDIKTFTNANWSGSRTPRSGINGYIQTKNKEREQPQLESSRCNNTPFLLTGGFPCQPFSCAGKRRGKEDDRYLWEEMLRVIKEFKPTWIIGENVNGIRSMEFQDGVSELEGDTAFQEDGNGDYTNVLDGICDSLEAIGYEVQPVIIPACAVNAPHRRDRVWIVAHSTNSRVEGLRQERENPVFQNTGIISEGSGNTETEERGNGQSILAENVSRRPISNRGFGGIIAPDTEPEGLQGHFQQQTEPTGAYCRCLADCHAPDTSNQGLQRGEETGNTSINGEESRNELIGRCLGWEEPWLEVAQRFCKLDAGLPSGLVGYLGVTEEHLKHRDEHRVQKLKALGNAIVPQVAFELMKAILEAENVKP